MKYSIKDFLSSKIALDVNEKDRPEFNRLMDEAGMKWGCGHEASVHDWFPCRADGKALHENRGSLPVVNFSDLAPVTHTPADFFAGRIGVRCETRAEYDALMRECEAKGIKWISGEPLSGKLPKTIEAGEPETFRIMGNGLVCNIIDFDDAVPFRAIFPDPWADFCAGKCYLRVKKEEWVEFAKRCEAAGIKWCWGVPVREIGSALHGNDGPIYAFMDKRGLNSYGPEATCTTDLPIRPFSAIARPQPYDGRGKHKVGDLFEVAGGDNFNVGDIIRLCDDDGSICPKFERLSDGEQHYKIWRNLKPHAASAPRIEITTDGRVTTATLYEDGKAVRTGTATCAPRDTFDFMEGASLAQERLRFGDDARLVDEVRVMALADGVKKLADEIKEAVK